MQRKSQIGKNPWRWLVPASLILAIVAWCWLTTSGRGEYRASPNGCWVAHASNLTRGTVSLRRESFTAFSIVSQGGEHLWDIELRGVQVKVPDFGLRDKRFIAWNPDSTTVAFELVGATDLVIPVPTKSAGCGGAGQLPY